MLFRSRQDQDIALFLGWIRSTYALGSQECDLAELDFAVWTAATGTPVATFMHHDAEIGIRLSSPRWLLAYRSGGETVIAEISEELARAVRSYRPGIDPTELSRAAALTDQEAREALETLVTEGIV